MRSGVLQQLDLIVGARDDPPAVDDDSADRHFTGSKGLLCLTKRLSHEGGVGIGVGHHVHDSSQRVAARCAILLRAVFVLRFDHVAWLISFTSRRRVGHRRPVRSLLLSTAILVLGTFTAAGQDQERKLFDRLLRPDMSLQNNAQNKQFTAVGSTTTKQARTKSFYVTERQPEKAFTEPRKYHTPTFDLRKPRYVAPEAKLTTRTTIAKANVPYSTPSYRGVKSAPAADKITETSSFPETRPFLVKGKSQKALSAQDRPLTIEQVRELLNKNK